jgi:hypothetical protein
MWSNTQHTKLINLYESIKYQKQNQCNSSFKQHLKNDNIQGNNMRLKESYIEKFKGLLLIDIKGLL